MSTLHTSLLKWVLLFIWIFPIGLYQPVLAIPNISYVREASNTSEESETGVPYTVIDTDPNGIQLYTVGNNIVRSSNGTLHVVYSLATSQSTRWYVYSRSSQDNGQTWSRAVRVDRWPDSNWMVESIAVDGQDRLYVGYTFNVGSFFVRSLDRGQTWVDEIGLHDDGWGDWDWWPVIAVDQNGTLHAVYIAEYGWNQPPRNVMYRTSNDGGLTWSTRQQLTQYPRGHTELGAVVPNLYVGKDGWLFVTYSYYFSSAQRFEQRFLYYDGATWSDPIDLSTPGRATRTGSDMAVDSTGKLHLVWSEYNPDHRLFELYYRTFDPATRTLSTPRALSENENVSSASIGIFANDKIVIAYDRFTQTNNQDIYQGVYVRTSQDNFATARRISTHPNARQPNVRSSFAFMHQPEREDIIWIEPQQEPATGFNLVYADLSGVNPPPPALTVETYVTKVVNPGQDVPVLVQYRNTMLEAARNAVLVLHLPEGIPLRRCTGDATYHYLEHAVIWRLGNLEPNTQGRFVCWLSIPWGMSARQVQVTAKLDADNSPTRVLDLAKYRNYQANPVTSERYLTQTEIHNLLSVPSISELHQIAVQRGFTFSRVGQRITHQDGTTINVLVYVKFDPFGLILMMVGEDQAWLIQQTDEAIEFLDRSGGLVFDSRTGASMDYGEWAAETTPAATLLQAQPANTYTPSFGVCVRNCLISNGAMAFVDAGVDTVMALYQIPWNALKVSYHAVTRNWTELAKDALSALPYKNFTHRVVEWIDCRKKCKADPNTYDCAADAGVIRKKWCEGTLRVSIRCGRMRMWGLPQFENCRPFACLNGECTEDLCLFTPRLQAHNQVQTAAQICSTGTTRPSNCSIDDMAIEPAHDPNAKYVAPQGDIVPGEQLTYTIEYENEGAGVAYDVYIIDTLDPNLDETTLTISNNGTYDPATRQVRWIIGELAPGAGGQVTMTVRTRPNLPSGTIIANQAFVYFPSALEVTPTDLVVNTINTLVAEPQAVETTGQQPVNIQLRGRDATGATPEYVIVTQPRYGVLEGQAPNLTYRAMAGFSGMDEFSFRVVLGEAQSDTARVVITVHPDMSDRTAPTIIDVYPQPNARGILAAATPATENPTSYLPYLSVTFSEPMNPATLNNSITVDGITGTTQYDPYARSLRFLPSVPLQAGRTYTATLRGTVADLAGNQLGTDYSWSFTTAGEAAIRVMLPTAQLTALPFPPIAVGQTSTSGPIKIFSQGTGSLTIGNISMSGTNAGDFTIINDTCSGRTLQPQESCTFHINYRPSAQGLRTAVLNIPSNDPLNPIYSVALRSTHIVVFLPITTR